ncbi:Scr1 family TA system antitoxin-like transcriptional regulator [Streptomyces sp. BE20]|uniref:Scr1 family TA system antitoxin-like transcriptional regulator n=1 Tax=Streptomyces sp. BE20 TaxID=3002525 RepID=UPI002E794323|nr:Scr1 family TA system antitoxin-like transcriptional regulator [Streptomyces sp. BE20]MEE1823756.1 Scr1 family TA system antitoxin-like transcriptional regulator [Streptomyces sp. BE20]
MIIRLPSPPAALADRVLGAHLRHLRECQGEPLTTVSGRLPARLRATLGDLAATEAGHGTVLRPASVTGVGPALARAYGAGQVAADDWRACAQECERRAAAGFPDGFDDPGPGWAHRYQILEEHASGLLFTVGGWFLPVPLLTDRLEEVLWSRRPRAPSRRGREGVPLGALSGTGCALCQVYRGDLLTDHAALAWWQRDAHRARVRAFAARIRTPNALATTVLLDEAVLHRRTGGQELHAEQMAYLAALAATTSLRIRVVPMATGMRVPIEHVGLVVDGDVLTVGLSDWGASYRAGPDPWLAGLEEHSLDEDASLDLLRRAAGGTLRAEGIGR